MKAPAVSRETATATATAIIDRKEAAEDNSTVFFPSSSFFFSFHFCLHF